VLLVENDNVRIALVVALDKLCSFKVVSSPTEQLFYYPSLRREVRRFDELTVAWCGGPQFDVHALFRALQIDPIKDFRIASIDVGCTGLSIASALEEATHGRVTLVRRAV